MINLFKLQKKDDENLFFAGIDLSGKKAIATYSYDAFFTLADNYSLSMELERLGLSKLDFNFIELTGDSEDLFNEYKASCYVFMKLNEFTTNAIIDLKVSAINKLNSYISRNFSFIKENLPKTIEDIKADGGFKKAYQVTFDAMKEKAKKQGISLYCSNVTNYNNSLCLHVKFSNYSTNRFNFEDLVYFEANAIAPTFKKITANQYKKALAKIESNNELKRKMNGENSRLKSKFFLR